MNKNKKSLHPALGRKDRGATQIRWKNQPHWCAVKGADLPARKVDTALSVTGFQHPGSLWADSRTDGFRHRWVIYMIQYCTTIGWKNQVPGRIFCEKLWYAEFVVKILCEFVKKALQDGGIMV